MIYEMRIYHIYPNRMKAIHKRFAEVTLDLFRKHNIEVVDFWEDAGAEKLYYIVEYANRESRDAQWAAFTSDAEWQRARALSESDGPIVEKVEEIFLTRVPYWKTR